MPIALIPTLAELELVTGGTGRPQRRAALAAAKTREDGEPVALALIPVRESRAR
jgi:hypothetical protein